MRVAPLALTNLKDALAHEYAIVFAKMRARIFDGGANELARIKPDDGK
jgi:hypothetical protein